ncbi:hypothetical protein [Parasulfitobacter algicola]|uniref:DinB/UmuC family translesion DNA polymerase n=1 Tax=Parasulfitobacter algicola TaxID=2614809 RepID=UPI003CCE2561
MKKRAHSISKVLAPRYRPAPQAYLVGRWLLEKSAERMRRDGYCTRRFSLHVRWYPDGRWSDNRSVAATQDTR